MPPAGASREQRASQEACALEVMGGDKLMARKFLEMCAAPISAAACREDSIGAAADSGGAGFAEQGPGARSLPKVPVSLCIEKPLLAKVGVFLVWYAPSLDVPEVYEAARLWWDSHASSFTDAKGNLVQGWQNMPLSPLPSSVAEFVAEVTGLESDMCGYAYSFCCSCKVRTAPTTSPTFCSVCEPVPSRASMDW